jgi:diadenylate cyclase
MSLGTRHRSEVLHLALAKVAPGTALREGLDRIVRAKMGALLVLGDFPTVLNICSGGFLLDSAYSPQRLSELAKMDGAVILGSDATRIARANVHLVPDPLTTTSETGTRHRTAERVARSITVPVVSVSEEMGVITVYVGEHKHVLQEIGRLLERANQALQTLERYKARLDDVTSALGALEVEDVVTLRDVSAVVQRSEMVRRISDEIDMMIVELGVDARLLRLQLDELYSGTENDLDLVVKDYAPDIQPGTVEAILATLQELDDDALLDTRSVAGILVPLTPDTDLDQPLQPRGYRLLSRIPRMSEALAHNVVERFGSLAKVLRSTASDLAEVPGVDEARARVIKDALGRLAETSILEQYG